MDANTKKLCESFSETEDAYEYYDAGNHWCKNCNTICGTLFDFFTHMHNKRHRQVRIVRHSFLMPPSQRNLIRKVTHHIQQYRQHSSICIMERTIICLEINIKKFNKMKNYAF